LGVVASILVNFYDVIFGSVMEFLHLIFEIVEMGLDKVVEYIFETELQETQLIVFYMLLAIGGILIFLVWKVLVKMFGGVSQAVHKECSELKTELVTDWQGMSITNRVILVIVFLLVNYLASFLLF
jgi:hypothetical protein